MFAVARNLPYPLVYSFAFPCFLFFQYFERFFPSLPAEVSLIVFSLGFWSFKYHLFISPSCLQPESVLFRKRNESMEIRPLRVSWSSVTILSAIPTLDKYPASDGFCP